MDQLTPSDEIRYQKLLKGAAANPLEFRRHARQSADNYSRSVRRLLGRVNTRHTSTYLLMSEWSARILPEIETIQKARQSTPLKNALSKHLQISGSAATDLAKDLAGDRISEAYDTFLKLCYGKRGRARRAASQLFDRPLEDVCAIRDCFLDYYLTQRVAKESKITVYDSQSPILQRAAQKIVDGNQVKKYNRQQTKRLAAIDKRQQVLKTANQDLIARIHTLDLDTVLALDAYRQYQKQLDKLRLDNQTSTKRLALFASATKKIRQTHAERHSPGTALATIHAATASLETVLIELFDMTDAERNQLMSQLKEYRDLDREAAVIRKQHVAYISR